MIAPVSHQRSVTGVQQQAGGAVEPDATGVEAAIVPGPHGLRFRVVHRPHATPPRGTILAIPPFAEEMNKSRRMAARLARACATAGWQVVQADLHGCGDSAGEFREASWQAWIDELRVELDRALDSGRPVWLWCTRAGALLASELLHAERAVHLLLWNPVLSGAQHLQQFLRLHTGAKVIGSAKANAELTPAQALKAGQLVEVGGYELNPGLAAALGSASFRVPDRYAARIVWLEVVASEQEPAPTSAQAERWIEQAAVRGIAVEIEAMRGPAFWQTQEIEQCERLLERSLARLESKAVERA